MNNDEAKLKALAALVGGVVVDGRVYRPEPMPSGVCEGCAFAKREKPLEDIRARANCHEANEQRYCVDFVWMEL